MEALLLELKQRETENRKLFGKEYASHPVLLIAGNPIAYAGDINLIAFGH